MTMNMPAEKILFVDDEPRMLASIIRQLKGRFNVYTAQNGQAALDLVRDQGPFAVAVSDFRMPGMDGAEFLATLMAREPRTVRILLTGYANLDNALRAVNEGRIFRLLTKPCDLETLGMALVAAIKQYRLEGAEKELLEKTLTGSIGVLMDILGLFNMSALGRAARIRELALDLARELGVESQWTLATAANLSQLGTMLLTPQSLEFFLTQGELAGEDKQVFDMHPSIGSDLLRKIPKMGDVADTILFQEKRYDGSGPPLEIAKAGDDIPLEARILKVASDFDLLETRGVPRTQILKTIRGRDGWYDKRVLVALQQLLNKTDEQAIKDVDIRDLTEAMVFIESVRTKEGRLIVPKGQRVNRVLVRHLEQFDKSFGLRKPLKVINKVDREDK